MLHISAHTDGFGSFIFAGTSVCLGSSIQGVQPILSGDVVRFLFFGVESGGLQGDTVLLIQTIGGISGAEQGSE